jgi:hypothetical protein
MEGYLRDLNVDPEAETRQGLKQCYERLIQVMFDNLDIFVRETQTANIEDKEQLNAHIMTLGTLLTFP